MAHGAAISNIAEQVLRQKWEVSCIAANFFKTIMAKSA